MNIHQLIAGMFGRSMKAKPKSVDLTPDQIEAKMSDILREFLARQSMPYDQQTDDRLCGEYLRLWFALKKQSSSNP